jgi:1,2-dihydroxy-3-keto-5-methylthiopentene dioxygenase
MAVVTYRESGRIVAEAAEISAALAPLGIWYRRFEGSDALPAAEGGYVTADVINVTPETPGLQAMLDRFNQEHYHDEDEVRFIVHGRGLFHIHPAAGEVLSIEVVKGDMIRVPRGTHHWFDLCADRTIRAIRLFQDKSGWTPHYTATGVDARFQPLCFGPRYLPHDGAARSAI